MNEPSFLSFLPWWGWTLWGVAVAALSVVVSIKVVALRDRLIGRAPRSSAEPRGVRPGS